MASGRHAVVWLNGPFGIGKTTVARELVVRIPGARIVDPERIGWVMRRTAWRGRDYQEVALWRSLAARRITQVARRHLVIVPMTVARSDVLDKVADDAIMFLLTAQRSTIVDRIEASGEAVEWRRSNLDRYLAAFVEPAFGKPIDTDGIGPAAVAKRIQHLTLSRG